MPFKRKRDRGREQFDIVPVPPPDKLTMEQRIRAARLAMFGVMLKEALDG